MPRPVVHDDPADVPSPLDVAAAAFGQTGPKFELRIRTAGPLPLKALGSTPGRSLCLLVEQRRPVRSQRICLAVAKDGRLSLVETRRRADGVYVAAHAVAAHVRRTSADALLATFTPAAARLTHGRVVWHVVSEWADDAACPAPAAAGVSVCHDAVPDRGGVAARVHLGYAVGCVPAGASKRSNGPRTSHRVALTFDDGPGPQTPAVLRILRRAHIRATFFELGVQVQQYPALVRQTLAEGHVIGNHTWDHKAMTSLSSGDADRELTRTSTAIERASATRRACSGRRAAHQGRGRGHRASAAAEHRLGRRPAGLEAARYGSIVANVLGHARPDPSSCSTTRADRGRRRSPRCRRSSPACGRAT